MSAPVTKQDIQILTKHLHSIEKKLEQHDQRFDVQDDRIVALMDTASGFEKSMHEFRLHVDLSFERLRTDLSDAWHDDNDALKVRVTRLESKTGLRT